MKSIRSILVFFSLLLFLAISCSPKVQVQSDAKNMMPLPVVADKVEIMYTGETVPTGAEQIGKIKITDNGLSINCGLLEILNLGKAQAQQAGGNILYITKISLPDTWSTCFRIEGIVYKHITHSVVQTPTEEARNTTNQDDIEIVERQPGFPGGEASLQLFIAKHFVYPATALKDKVGGLVILQFVVDKTGKVSNVEVKQGIRSDLDEEAKRLVTIFPEFTPAFLNNRAVSFRYTIPMRFSPPAPLFKKKGNK